MFSKPFIQVQYYELKINDTNEANIYILYLVFMSEAESGEGGWGIERGTRKRNSVSSIL